MSLTALRTDSLSARIILALAAAACLAGVWFSVRWNLANAISSRADQKEIAELALELGPSDPQTHFAAAVIYQKTLDPDDVSRSLSEYEKAAALSPKNYLCWLNLGRARERAGDAAGGELAVRRALELAPNYADVQWAYGNTLLRAGRNDEAFEQIRRASASKPSFNGPAVVAAMQIFDDDITKVRQATGNIPGANASLAAYLAAQQRYDEAADVWKQIPADVRLSDFNEAGRSLVSVFRMANQFRHASDVFYDVSVGQRPPTGTVFDGGFESGVKLKDPGEFEWLIPGGSEPQIAISTVQKHGGNSSLLLVFDTMETSDFRSLGQVVAVEPGATYEFETYYRSELKAPFTVRWEIADASNRGVIVAKTAPVAAISEWQPLRIQFSVPQTIDGIVFYITRAGCQSPVCPINGRLWFDDVSIRRL